MAEINATGGCLCGRLRYRVRGDIVWTGYCHCESCRRFTGSVVTNWLGISDTDLEFDGDWPATHSMGGTTRGFCPACGSSMTCEVERFPNYIQLHIGSLDDPNAVLPMAHVHHSEKLGWFEIDDGLPKYPHSAADKGDWRS